MPAKRNPPDPHDAARAEWAGLTEAQRWEQAYRAEREHATKLEAERDAWKLLAEARGTIMVAYRTGRRPPESAFAAIEKAEKVLGPQ
jgi:hypothetical protein